MFYVAYIRKFDHFKADAKIFENKNSASLWLSEVHEKLGNCQVWSGIQEFQTIEEARDFEDYQEN